MTEKSCLEPNDVTQKIRESSVFCRTILSENCDTSRLPKISFFSFYVIIHTASNAHTRVLLAMGFSIMCVLSERKYLWFEIDEDVIMWSCT